MNTRRIAAVLTLVGALALTAPVSASAQISVFTDKASFIGASNSVLVADFESHGEGVIGNFSEGGIDFTTLGGPLYIATPGGPASANFTTPPITSNVLTGNGEDDFFLSFTLSGLDAFGFDVYTNNSVAPQVKVYGPGLTLLETVSLTQPQNSVGFFGVTATQSIERVDFLSTNGAVKNAGIDNVMVGPASAVVPEPATFVLLGTGLLGLGVAARRRRDGGPSPE